ncbi:MAG: DUF1854 domain-containing protein [Burkholderiaceae bacterium]|nr:DUF1854 domain-containing protein [Burkholderiaceae bacterium]
MSEPPIAPLPISRNAFGRLVFTAADGSVVENVLPVRAFPISAPDEGLALVAPDGRELVWIERLDQLDPDTRALIAESLAEREFLPVVSGIVAVSSYVTPCAWTVATDRGEARFVLAGEEFIRRLPGDSLLITDNQGVNWLIRSMAALDLASRRILDRFL